MYIYITSLAYRDGYSKKRLEFLTKKLKKAGLIDKAKKIKVIGVDGRTVKKEDYIDKILCCDFKHGWLKNMHGTIGSALAHISVWQDIDKNQIQDDVLVLEDDSDIHENFLEMIPKKMPEDYDVLYAHIYNYLAYENGELFSENLKKCKNFNGILEIHSYFINGKNIKKILSSILPCGGPLDVELGGNKNIIKYILNPQLKASGQFAVESIRYFYDDFYRNANAYFNHPKNELEKISSDYTWKICVETTLLKGISLFGSCANCEGMGHKNSIQRNDTSARIKLEVFIKDGDKKHVLDFNLGDNTIYAKDGKIYEELYFNIPNSLNLLKNKTYSMRFEYTKNPKSCFFDAKTTKEIKISKDFIYI